jgi:hypothetical protein
VQDGGALGGVGSEVVSTKQGIEVEHGMSLSTI